MGSIKGFIDWVKGSELEDELRRRDAPSDETKNLRWIASHHLTIEDPVRRSYDSDAPGTRLAARHEIAADQGCKHQYYYTAGCGSGQAGSL